MHVKCGTVSFNANLNFSNLCVLKVAMLRKKSLDFTGFTKSLVRGSWEAFSSSSPWTPQEYLLLDAVHYYSQGLKKSADVLVS